MDWFASGSFLVRIGEDMISKQLSCFGGSPLRLSRKKCVHAVRLCTDWVSTVPVEQILPVPDTMPIPNWKISRLTLE